MMLQQHTKCLLINAVSVSFVFRCFYWPNQRIATLGLKSMEESSTLHAGQINQDHHSECPPTDILKAILYPIRFYKKQGLGFVESVEQTKVYSETFYLVLNNQTSAVSVCYGGTTMYTSFHATANAYYHRVKEGSRACGKGLRPHQSSRLEQEVMQETSESQQMTNPATMFTFV